MSNGLNPRGGPERIWGPETRHSLISSVDARQPSALGTAASAAALGLFKGPGQWLAKVSVKFGPVRPCAVCKKWPGRFTR
jgi:hypothetical protein